VRRSYSVIAKKLNLTVVIVCKSNLVNIAQMCSRHLEDWIKHWLFLTYKNIFCVYHDLIYCPRSVWVKQVEYWLEKRPKIIWLSDICKKILQILRELSSLTTKKIYRQAKSLNPNTTFLYLQYVTFSDRIHRKKENLCCHDYSKEPT
jgi:hypothetical protein